MTTLEFTDETAPLAGVTSEPRDEVPPLDNDPEPVICGHPNAKGDPCLKPPHATGRHRYKPYAAGSGETGSRPRANGNLAAQAADVLAQVNDVFGLGLMAFGFHKSASALAARNEPFREGAQAALATDPALCRMILRGGMASAKLSLTLQYVMLTAAVAPFVKMELDERRDYTGE